MSKKYQWLIVVTLSVVLGFRQYDGNGFDQIRAGFLNPPDSIRITAFYYWLNNHISREGVIRDLQAMKQAGITRVFLGTNIRNRTSMSRDTAGQYFGNVKVFSDEWWQVVHTALKTASDLDIEVGLFNCPGWSQSGGPWVKPEQAMRYLDASEIRLKGPARISTLLKKTDSIFQNVKVLAIRVAPDYAQNLLDAPGVKMHSSTLLIESSVPGGVPRYILTEKESVLNIELPQKAAVRSLTFYPAEYLNTKVDVQVKTDTGFTSIQKAEIIRARTVEDLAKGFEPHAPFFLPLDEVTAKSFRLVFSKGGTGKSQMADIVMSSTPVIKNLPEKKLAKVTGSAAWWTGSGSKAIANTDSNLSLPVTGDVLDISKYMSPDGRLTWNAPEGYWIIMRTGMRIINVQNGPASFEAEGLEVDKMNSTHVRSHFNAFVGEVLRRIPAQDRKTFKMVVMDSYERGGFNFTDGFLDDFKKQYGYDATPYLPVYSGHIIGSAENTDRFLWDMRRMVADKLSYDYVGGFTRISHENGLRTWLENYGHSGYPGEFLQYGGQADEVAGEYWVEPIGDRRFENRAAASAAHIYGKNKVWSESFTSGSWVKNLGYSTYPKELKSLSDWAFAQGVNSTVLHVYIQQPYEEVYPGIDAWFGTEFNRKNTWFPHMDLLTMYHRRCNFMLQQGENVADIAYYIGEDNPVMRGAMEPRLPRGFNYDFINAEVIVRDMMVKDGKLLLPNGTTYSVLVLPPQETMRPQVLQKIEQLVLAGGVILGNPPSRSPSLQNYPNADKLVEQQAKQLWGDGSEKKRTYGKGKVFRNISLEQVLQSLTITPDCVTGHSAVQYTHRTLNGKDIYFLANLSDKPVKFTATFRVTGLQPEWWDALTGTARKLPVFKQDINTVTIPAELPANGSAFVIFCDKGTPMASGSITNFSNPSITTAIGGPWQLRFEHDSIKRGPAKPIILNELKDWTTFDDNSIRYYSGKAVYTTSFKVQSVSRHKNYYLDLGDLVATAKVKVNGQYIGGVWAHPYRPAVNTALKRGNNTLEIEVMNTWKNRLIGDHLLPEKSRIVYSRVNAWNGDANLQQSGLLGPVALLEADR